MPEIVEPVALDALVVDCKPLSSFLVDLPPLARRGMVSEQEGFPGVVAEIVANQEKFGDKAGITKADMDDFTLANDQIAQIDARLPAARKLVEILEETRAKLDDQRQRHVSAIANAVERRARMRGDDELLAKYEKTRAYRSAIAVKAAKTRSRKAKAEAAQAEAAKNAAEQKQVPASSIG